MPGVGLLLDGLRTAIGSMAQPGAVSQAVLVEKDMHRGCWECALLAPRWGTALCLPQDALRAGFLPPTRVAGTACRWGFMANMCLPAKALCAATGLEPADLRPHKQACCSAQWPTYLLSPSSTLIQLQSAWPEPRSQQLSWRFNSVSYLSDLGQIICFPGPHFLSL